MTQNETILALLRDRGPRGLTPMEALREAGTMRLAARISDLRAAGHLITTETVTTPNGARVARYVWHDPAECVPPKVAPTWDEMRAWTEAEKREAWGR